MVVLFKHKLFIYASLLIVLQQVAVAFSTYIIATAGIAAGRGDISAVINDIVIFFLAILVAYVLGSCALFLESRLTNELWEAYVSQLVEGISEKISFATLKNKQMTISWIGGEALSTFENTCFFVIEFLSIYCNILFNIIAFYLALGKDIALSMLVAIFLSFVLIMIFKSKIKNLANNIQDKKLNALTYMNLLWDSSFFGNINLKTTSKLTAKKKMDAFFNDNVKYAMVEQVIACLPLLIAIPVVIVAAYYSIINNFVVVSALVATLPRSLQIFQNVHTAGVYNSKVALLWKKLKNLKNFSIKDSILIAPGVGFIEDVNGSTGEQQMQQIKFAVAQNIKLLLLDEWDANLDKANVQIINEIIQDYAERMLILEVRHSR